MMQNNNANLFCERYLGYYSFDNVNCKYSDFDKLSEFTRFSNTPYQLNSPDRYQVIRNSKYYEGDLMKIVIEPNKFKEAERIFIGSTKDGRESNSNQYNATGNSMQSWKRNYNTSQDEGMSNWKLELNVKKIHKDETSKNYGFCATKTYESTEVRQNNDKNGEPIDYDYLTDYFIGTESMPNKSFEQPTYVEFHIPIKLSTDDTRKEQTGLSCNYDVFDYGHRCANVDKLPIVDPTFNTAKNEECCSKKSNVLKLCDVTPNKLTRGNDSVASNNISALVISPPGLVKNKIGAKRVKNKKGWKLIRIDCPLRIQISKDAIDFKNCSVRDPRLRHLRS